MAVQRGTGKRRRSSKSRGTTKRLTASTNDRGGLKVSAKARRLATRRERATLQTIQESVKRLTEVSGAGTFPIDPIDFGTHGDDKFRRISGVEGLRDFSTFTHERMQELAFALGRTHPFAWRIIKLHEAFGIGGPITWEAKDPRVAAAIKEFWFDPVNRWPIRFPKKIRELTIFGELFIPVFVRDTDGRVRVGTIDPREVHRVVANKENADIIERIDTAKELVQKGVAVVTTQSTETIKREVIKVDEEEGSETEGRLVGDIFYIRINDVGKSVRGISDLSPILDWLDIMDDNLFTVAESDREARSFIWDITVEGTEDQIKVIKRDIENQDIKPGSFRIHNNKVTWQAVAPNIQASEAQTVARLIKLHVLAGAGFPEHWFSEAGDANRAVASEMGIPTTRQLYERQQFIRYSLTEIFRFVVDQKIIAGMIPKDADTSFKVNMPPIWVRDMNAVADGLSKTTVSLSQGVEEEFITAEEGRQIFRHFISQMGIELGAAGEITEAKNQKGRAMNGTSTLQIGKDGRMGELSLDVERGAEGTGRST